MKPFWKKYPEEEIEETFQAFSAETKGTDAAKTDGGAMETAYGCSAKGSTAKGNADCSDAGIRSAC